VNRYVEQKAEKKKLAAEKEKMQRKILQELQSQTPSWDQEYAHQFRINLITAQLQGRKEEVKQLKAEQVQLRKFQALENKAEKKMKRKERERKAIEKKAEQTRKRKEREEQSEFRGWSKLLEKEAIKYVKELKKKDQKIVPKKKKQQPVKKRPVSAKKKPTFTPSISAPSHAGCILTPDVSICLDAYPPSKYFQQQQVVKATRSTAGEETVSGRWTSEEHEAFISAYQMYGKDWKKVASVVKTRTVIQTRTHAQKYILKLQKAASSADSTTQQKHKRNLEAGGVTQTPSGTWQARIYYNKVQSNIGNFDSEATARSAVELAREKLTTSDGNIYEGEELKAIIKCVRDTFRVDKKQKNNPKKKSARKKTSVPEKKSVPKKNEKKSGNSNSVRFTVTKPEDGKLGLIFEWSLWGARVTGFVQDSVFIMTPLTTGMILESVNGVKCDGFKHTRDLLLDATGEIKIIAKRSPS